MFSPADGNFASGSEYRMVEDVFIPIFFAFLIGGVAAFAKNCLEGGGIVQYPALYMGIGNRIYEWNMIRKASGLHAVYLFSFLIVSLAVCVYGRYNGIRHGDQASLDLYKVRS